MAADVRSKISRQHYVLRPPSEQLVDLHVYLAPQERWVERRKLAKNHIVDYSISSGFIRVIPQQTLFELRDEIDSQLGYEVLPRNYIFLRSVGRNFTQVKPKQEMEMKVKNFMPPYASEPEIYIKEGVYDSRWSQAEDSGLDDSLTDSNFSSFKSNRDRGTPDSNDELTSSPGPVQSPTTSGQGSSSTSSEDMAADVVTASSSHAVSIAPTIKPEESTAVASTRTTVNGPSTTRNRVAAQRNRDNPPGDSVPKNKPQGLPSQSKSQIRNYPLTEARQRRRAAAGSNSGDSDTSSGPNKGQISDISTTSRRRASNRSSIEGGMTNKNESSNHHSKTNGRKTEHKSRVVAKKQALSELNNGKLKEEDENEENKKDDDKEKQEAAGTEKTSERQIDDEKPQSEKTPEGEGEEGDLLVESTTIKLLDDDGKEIETVPIEYVTLDPNESLKKEDANDEEITRHHELSILDESRDGQDGESEEKSTSETLVQVELGGGEGEQEEEMKKGGRGNESGDASSRLNETVKSRADAGAEDDVENEKSRLDEESKMGVEVRVNGDSGSSPAAFPVDQEGGETGEQKYGEAEVETVPQLSIDVSVVEIDETNKDYDGSQQKGEGDVPGDGTEKTEAQAASDTSAENVEGGGSGEENVERNETGKTEENNTNSVESGKVEGTTTELKESELDSTQGNGSGNGKTSRGEEKDENAEEESITEETQQESKTDNFVENEAAQAVTNESKAQDDSSLKFESSAGNETTNEAEPLAENEATAEVEPSTENEATAEVDPSTENEATAEAEPSAENENTTEAEPSAENEATAEAEPTAENEATSEAELPSAENLTTTEAESSSENITTTEAESSSENLTTTEGVSLSENFTTTEAESSAGNKRTLEVEPSTENEATNEAEPSTENEATNEDEPSGENEAINNVEASTQDETTTELESKGQDDETQLGEPILQDDDAASRIEETNENEANLETETNNKDLTGEYYDTADEVACSADSETTMDNETTTQNEAPTDEGGLKKEVVGEDGVITPLDEPTKDEGVPEDVGTNDEETAEINVNSEDGASNKDEISVNEFQSPSSDKKDSKSKRKSKASVAALKLKGSNAESSTSRKLANKGGKLPLPTASKRKSSSDRLQVQSDTSGPGIGSLRRSHSDSNGISRLGLRAEGKGLGAYGNQFYSSYNLMKDIEDMDLENMKKYLSDARTDRKELEVQREALVRRIRQLHSKANKIKEQAREAWRRRYLEAKKQTPKLEEECSRLRLELEKYLRELIAKVQGGNLDFPPSFGVTKGEMPSNRFSYKIMILRMLQEIEDLRRRSEGAKIRHAAEFRLREQAENDVKALREELVKKKIQVTLTRNQADSVLRDSYYTNSF